MDKKVLVTGSSGFVGEKLVEKLSNNGVQAQKADVKDGIDLCEPMSFSRISNVDIVVHLAAITSVPESFKNPWLFLNKNYSATLGALEICRMNHASMIYISSYLYGHPKYLPIDEDHPLSPHNPYAQSKKVSEDLCRGYQRDFGVPVTILRPFNLYGPGLRDNSLIPSIISQLPKGQVELLDTEPKRDYLYVDDLCDVIIKALKFEPNEVEVFNIGSGASISVECLAKMIISISGLNVSVIDHHKRRKGEVMDCVANIEKACTILGWAPKWSLENGLKTCLQSWKI